MAPARPPVVPSSKLFSNKPEESFDENESSKELLLFAQATRASLVSLRRYEVDGENTNESSELTEDRFKASAPSARCSAPVSNREG